MPKITDLTHFQRMELQVLAELRPDLGLSISRTTASFDSSEDTLRAILAHIAQFDTRTQRGPITALHSVKRKVAKTIPALTHLQAVALIDGTHRTAY